MTAAAARLDPRAREHLAAYAAPVLRRRRRAEPEVKRLAGRRGASVRARWRAPRRELKTKSMTRGFGLPLSAVAAEHVVVRRHLARERARRGCARSRGAAPSARRRAGPAPSGSRCAASPSRILSCCESPVSSRRLPSSSTMNISEATFGAVTPLKSGMPFQSRRSNGEPGAPLLNSSIRCLSSLRRRARRPGWRAAS